MPTGQGRASFTQSMAAQGREAHEKVKGLDTQLSAGGNLPAGIENGIAQLVDMHFVQVKEGKQNAGSWMFYAAGAVFEPKDHNGAPTEGLRTQISEPMFDTPTRSRKTVQDHLDYVYRVLRTFGVDTAELDFDDLEGQMAALVEAGPYFRFRTWAGQKTEVAQVNGRWSLTQDGKVVPGKTYPSQQAAQAANPFAGREPMVNHSWGQMVNYEASSSSGTQDDTGSAEGVAQDEAPPPAPVAKAPPKPTAPKPAATAPAKPAPAKAAPKKPAPPPVEEPVVDDLAGLAELADGGDEDAAAKVLKAAEEAGIPKATRDSTPTYTQLATMVSEAGTAAPDSDEPVWVPAVGEVYQYQATGKGGKLLDAQECEVTEVNEDLQVVSLKSLVNSKIAYKAVPWDKLKQEGE